MKLLLLEGIYLDYYHLDQRLVEVCKNRLKYPLITLFEIIDVISIKWLSMRIIKARNAYVKCNVNIPYIGKTDLKCF